jgi:membrane-associated phospholipid phosphatase
MNPFAILQLRRTSKTSAGSRRTKLDVLELLEDRCLLSTDVVLQWNEVLLNAIRADRTPPPPASRNMAIVHTAVYDAVNSIVGSHTPYLVAKGGPKDASVDAAAAQAAHDTLAALYPQQKPTFDAALSASLADIPDGAAENKGIATGRYAANMILKARANDGANDSVPYSPGTNPGDWQPTPPAFAASLFPQWPYVAPFAMTWAGQFRPDAPPALPSAEYAADFNEVKQLGGDGVTTPTTRAPEQTLIAHFWADGAGTETPPGHWNSIAQDVAEDQGTTVVQNARLFALLNIALADAAIDAWDCKYLFNYWRPMTAIRAADTDGNPDTIVDATWTPLLATPAFPSYTSGHSTFSSAGAAVLASFFGTDDVNFSTGSDVLPGVTRTFTSFSAAAAEAGQSRIYGGIHYQFDNQEALTSGDALGNYIAHNFLTPVDALLAAAAPGRVRNTAIRPNQVEPLLTEALSRWQAIGIDTAALGDIRIRIADLGGRTLGLAGGHTIWLDDSAAGWGWFVDKSPWSDSEFTRPGNQGEQNRIDLLSVLDHELGHLLGFDHERIGVMSDTIQAGSRQTPIQDSTGPGGYAVDVVAVSSEGLPFGGSRRSRCS